MPRTKQTARKSTGGMAPRRQLAHLVDQWNESHKIDTANLDIDSLVKYTDLSTAAHRLPIVVMSDDTATSTNDPSNIVSTMPIFDVGTINDGSYIVSRSRKTTQLKVDSVSEHGKKFLCRVLERSRKKYKHSSWVMVWENEDGSGYSILPQQMCKAGEYAEVNNILKSGKLHGCDLRGNAETNQYGLVSNVDLPSSTFVAVECGVVWSELIHDKIIDREGDPLLGLSSNLIPAKLLQSLSDKRAWKSYRQGCVKSSEVSSLRGVPGFVVESSFRGNETKHIDDPSWLFMASSGIEKETHQMPNLEARVILDLERLAITVGFETNRDVAKNTELTMDWGCWEQSKINLVVYVVYVV